MIIREVNNKLQILVYGGYSKEKKRSTYKVIGSMDKYLTVIPEELADKLEKRQQAQNVNYISASLNLLFVSIDRISDHLKTDKLDFDDFDIDQLETSYKQLLKALAKHNIKKTRKTKEPTKTSNTGLL